MRRERSCERLIYLFVCEDEDRSMRGKLDKNFVKLVLRYTINDSEGREERRERELTPASSILATSFESMTKMRAFVCG
jgi:hypothetical protein